MAFDLTTARHVVRIVVGNDNPERICSRQEAEDAMAKLNAALEGPPRGVVVGVEKGFSLIQIGEHQVVQQWIAYHVALPYKPPPQR